MSKKKNICKVCGVIIIDKSVHAIYCKECAEIIREIKQTKRQNEICTFCCRRRARIKELYKQIREKKKKVELLKIAEGK